MGLLTGVLGLPLAPVRAAIAVAEQVRRQAEEEYYDPAVIQRQLDEVDRLRDEGSLSATEAAWWEEELIGRLMGAES